MSTIIRYPLGSSVDDMLYIDGYNDGWRGRAPIANYHVYRLGHSDGLGDRITTLDISLDTLDLSDPEVHREFVAALRKYGVPL